MAGTLTKYTTNTGERLWRVRWDLPEGPNGQRRQRSKSGFQTKRDAEAWLHQTLDGQLNRGRVSVRSDRALADYAMAWIEGRRDLKPTAVDNMRVALSVHVVPRLGHRKVQDVSAEDVAWLYVELQERGKVGRGGCRTAGFTCPDHDCSPDLHDGLAPKSVSHVHAALRAVLAQAVEDNLIASNPCETNTAKRARPKGGRSTSRITEDQCWTEAQARAFLSATGGHDHGSLWAVLAGTGLRRGEALALRWNDVDLDAGTLTVRRSVTAVRGEVVTDDDGGKTDAARRVLTIGPELVAAIRAHRSRQAERRLAAGPVWEDTGHLFTEDDGRPIHPNKASSTFTRTAKAEGMPGIGLHGLRHTHATMLLRAGVPITAVAQRLGHANPSITLAVYAHAVPADDRLAADATSRILFASH